MSDDLALVTRLPAGESGRIVGRLTEANIEAIAAVLALPTQVRKRKFGDEVGAINHLARRLGISPALIRRAKRDKRVRKLRDELLLEAIEDLFPTLTYRMVEEALNSEDPTKPYTVLAKIIGKLGDSGVQVNLNQNSNNTTVNFNQDGGVAEDRANVLWLKEMLESGDAKRLVETLKPLTPVAAEAELVQGGTDGKAEARVETPGGSATT